MGGNTMIYRAATIDECETLTRLRMAMRKEADGSCCEERLFPATLAFFQQNIKNGSHIALVCEHEGAIIATTGLSLLEMMPTAHHLNGRVARLLNMYVMPEYRRRGIAKQLLAFAVSCASEHGCGRIMLNPSEMGKTLYTNFGFTWLNNEYEYVL